MGSLTIVYNIYLETINLDNEQLKTDIDKCISNRVGFVGFKIETNLFAKAIAVCEYITGEGALETCAPYVTIRIRSHGGTAPPIISMAVVDCITSNITSYVQRVTGRTPKVEVTSELASGSVSTLTEREWATAIVTPGRDGLERSLKEVVQKLSQLVSKL